MRLGIVFGALIITLMAAIYAQFRMRESELRQGEALDRGERD